MTGLVLQLAIGPVYFFIMNIAMQKTIVNGLLAALAVAFVDYFYITLAIFGIGKLLEQKKIKRVFGIISSIVVMGFGYLTIEGALTAGLAAAAAVGPAGLLSSFTSTFLLTISSPMTIVFFTGIFAAKAVEYNYTKKELWVFGLGVGFATFVFMGSSVIIFSLIKSAVPHLLIQILNIIVGSLLIGYGGVRLIKLIGNK
jgi:threonine/homoserine/homoserine lactone efflux protein